MSKSEAIQAANQILASAGYDQCGRRLTAARKNQQRFEGRLRPVEPRLALALRERQALVTS